METKVYIVLQTGIIWGLLMHDSATCAGTSTTATITTVTAPPTTATVTEPSSTVDPTVVTGVQPTYGPIAGGTNITVSGSNFDTSYRIYIYLGHLQATLLFANKSVLVASTPALHETSVDKEFAVSIEFTGGRRVDTTFKFLYKSNPQINSIFPTKSIISGGTTLTVNGTSLDSVANAYLQVIMVYTIWWTLPGGGRTSNQTLTTFIERCSDMSENVLECPTPELDIPWEFRKSSNYDRRRRRSVPGIQRAKSYMAMRPNAEQTGHSGSDQTPRESPRGMGEFVRGLAGLNDVFVQFVEFFRGSSTTVQRADLNIRRLKRASDSEEPGGDYQVDFKTPNSELTFHLGFILDGFDKYDDLTDVTELSEYAELGVFRPPQIDRLHNDVLQYWPWLGNDLEIQGSEMLLGLTQSDYSVTIGKGQCAVVSVYDSILTCTPPPDEPEPLTDSKNSKGLLLVIHPGTKFYTEIGFITYRFRPITIIVAGCVVGFVVLVGFLLLLVILCKRRASRQLSGGAAGTSNQDPSGSEMDSVRQDKQSEPTRRAVPPGNSRYHRQGPKQ